MIPTSNLLKSAGVEEKLALVVATPKRFFVDLKILSRVNVGFDVLLN